MPKWHPTWGGILPMIQMIWWTPYPEFSPILWMEEKEERIIIPKTTLSLWMVSKLQGPNGWCSDIWCLHIYVEHIFGQTLEQTPVSGLRTVTALGSKKISLQETWSHGDHHPFTSDVPRYQISTSFLLTLGNPIPQKQPQKTTTKGRSPQVTSPALWAAQLYACERHAGKTAKPTVPCVDYMVVLHSFTVLQRVFVC